MISNEELDKIKMNFIIGPGRSGTTLLMMLLNYSDECVATPEIKHLIYFYKRFGTMKQISPEMKIEYEKYFSLFKVSSSNPLYQIDKEKVLSAFEGNESCDYGQLNKKIHLLLHNKTSSKIQSIVDKNNLYTFHFEKLIAIYPEAKFCVMIRDYRAFVASNLESQHKFKQNKSAVFYAIVWRFYAKKIQQLYLKYPEKISIVKYEILVENPEETIANIYYNFGLNFNDNIFDYRLSIEEKVKQYSATSNPDPRILKKITDLSKPISNSRVNIWNEKLNDKTRKKIEIICGNDGLFFNYKTENQFSSLEKIFMKIKYFYLEIRVYVFFKLNSINLHHFLNVKRRVKHNINNKYIRQ
jgi:hypothetical protein